VQRAHRARCVALCGADDRPRGCVRLGGPDPDGALGGLL